MEVMGAWDVCTFGNDAACDWSYDFLDNPKLGFVQETINTVIEASGFLDSDVASKCLAACEIIARLNGNWGVRNSYSSEIDKWVEINKIQVPGDLVALADAAIERILGHDSELLEIWDSGGYNEEWHQAVDDLRKRIKSTPKESC